MPDKRRIAISKPSTGEEEWQAVRAPLLSGWLTQGPEVAAFERAFAEFCGSRHALAASSATAGLHLALAALEIGPGDEVIVPAFTWVASANAVLYCGATPVLCDVDRETFNLDPAALAHAVTPRTRAIVAVHLFGLCADMDAIAAAAPGIQVIEDAACAAGAIYKGKQAGTLGRVGVFSFHPRKSITTGEGGMLTTDDEELALRVESLRSHGASVPEQQRLSGPRPYLLPEFNLLGFNYRLTDVQAAIGRVQLGKLLPMLEQRDRWAQYYHRELADIAWLRTPEVAQGSRHGWQAYVCYVDQRRPRNAVMQALEERGVATRPGTHAVHMLGYYRKRFGFVPDDFPGARDCDQHSMAIPLHNQMSPEDYAYVVEALHEIARE